MTFSGASLDYRTRIAALSLVAGPLLMAIGDLMHPEERMAPAEQVVIVVAHGEDPHSRCRRSRAALPLGEHNRAEKPERAVARSRRRPCSRERRRR